MMVPEGWKVSKLGNVVTHQKGFAFSSSDYTDLGARVIRVSDTTKSSIHNNNPIFINLDSYSHINLDRYLLLHGDVILTTVGSRPHIQDSMVGKAVRVSKDAEGALLNQNLVKLIPKNSKIINSFLYEILKSKRFIYYVSTLVRGNANQVSITLNDIFDFEFTSPCIKEQQEIAQILSIWDQAISTTEQLLANSQQQKKALMQQLLTGKKRLLDEEGREFREEWEVTALEKICDISTGKKDVNEGNPDGGYPFFTCANDHTYSDSYSYDFEALLIAGNGAIGKTHYYHGKFEAYQRTYILSKFNLQLSVKYLHQYIIYWLMRDIEREKQHSAMPYIKLGLLKKFKVSMPTKLEQQKIAAVLTTADAEITALEQKIEQLKQEKKALMQQLLTGKKRVKVKETN